MATLTMTPTVARRLRLHAQGLFAHGDLLPAQVVQRMVALQGQDLPAVLQAIAIRSRTGTTLDDVRAAFNSGQIVRGWTQRGTLFATTPQNLAALRLLTSERVKHSMRRTRADEGLDDKVLQHATTVACDVLAEGGVSRATMLDAWREDGIRVDGQRGYHLIVLLALDGVLHWGPFKETRQLMVATRTPSSADNLSMASPGGADAELRRIAHSYFQTRGPATTDDLAWWLGLPKTPVRQAVTKILTEQTEYSNSARTLNGADRLLPVEVHGKSMLTTREAFRDEAGVCAEPTPPAATQVTLVPAFDEIILGYQNRELVASKEALKALTPYKNGMFRPAVLIDGQLVGTWRRSPTRNELPFEIIDTLHPHDREAIEKAVTSWRLG